MRPTRRINTALFFLAILAASLTMNGCGDQKTVSFNSGGVTQKFSAGEATDTKDFPVSIYPQAKPIGSTQASGDPDDHSRFVMLSTSDPVEKVRDFYEGSLKHDGWQVNETVRQPTLVNLGASKNDQEASIMISADANGKTIISMALSQKTEGIPKLSDQAFTPDKLNPPTD